MSLNKDTYIRFCLCPWAGIQVLALNYSPETQNLMSETLCTIGNWHYSRLGNWLLTFWLVHRMCSVDPVAVHLSLPVTSHFSHDLAGNWMVPHHTFSRTQQRLTGRITIRILRGLFPNCFNRTRNMTFESKFIADSEPTPTMILYYPALVWSGIICVIRCLFHGKLLPISTCDHPPSRPMLGSR